MADEVKITAEQVKALREATGAGMMDCKRALQETGGDVEKAKEWLRKKGMASAAKRAARTATEGLIEAYIHFNGRVGVLVELNCETDFVAKTSDFRQLAKDIALHIAGSQTVRWVTRDQLPESELEAERRIYEAQAREQGKPENVIERIVTGKLEAYYKDAVLVDQPFVKDPDKTVGELIDEASGRLGEKVQVRRFVRFRLGEEAF
jgi:elongation factor Ts